MHRPQAASYVAIDNSGLEYNVVMPCVSEPEDSDPTVCTVIFYISNLRAFI